MKKKPAVVGIVKRVQIWNNIGNEGWYHIPVKSAPRNIRHCRYLAFYFPSIFGEDRMYRVIYYCEVKSIEIFKRIELFPQDVKHIRANKDYYKLNLGKIEKLPKAIPSRRWRYIVFIPTSLERLFSASEINDLYDTSPLEEAMYKKLKKNRITAERQVYVETDSTKYCLDFGVFCREGKIDIECDGETYHNLPKAYTKDRVRNNELTSHGWRVLRFGTKQIKNDIDGCIKTISKTVELLGGIE